MKVLILTENYPTKSALNNGIFIHQQVKALQRLGVDCRILLLHNWFPPFGFHNVHPYWVQGRKQHDDYFDEYEGVHIYKVPMFIKMPTRFFPESYYDRASCSLLKYIKRHKALTDADWIYAHFLTPMGYIAAKIKDALGMNLAVIARGDDVHAWPEKNTSLQAQFPLIFRKADLVLANSTNLGNDALKWMEADNIRKVETIYNGIDYNTYAPIASIEKKKVLKNKFGLSPEIKYLVCIATRVELKGWIELLRAIQMLGEKFDGWKLAIVAGARDNPDALNLTTIGKELGIEDRVQDIGGLPPSGVAEFLKACDAFVLASYNEGMANSLLEAMASGLPCIATNVGGHNEVIENNREGILVPAHEIAPLVNAIETVISNAQLREVMGQKAREKMMLFGDYFYNAQKLLLLMNSVDG